MVCFLTAEQPVNKKRKIKNKKEKDAACNKEEKENKLKEKKGNAAFTLYCISQINWLKILCLWHSAAF